MKPSVKKPGRRALVVAAVIAAIVLLLPLFLHVEHHGVPWEKVPGFWALYGFLGCAVIVVVSKLLGHALLQRPEDWYDREEDE